MIVYEFSCICGCQFEGWFQSRDDYVQQKDDELLSCPACGGNDVKKILSPVSTQSHSASSAKGLVYDEQVVKEAAEKVLKELQGFVMKEYDDVGPKLARETLEMKYGLKKPRNIRGVSTPEEEKILKKEGIELMKIPLPAKDDEEVN